MLIRCVFIAGLFLTGYNNLKAQGGLENIIVEKYYVSTARDTQNTDDGAYLPVGSVTYRIYADLKPVYRLQAVYGVPGHELRIETSTRFYNCGINDGRTANDIQPGNFKNNHLLLDSWVSVGAAAIDYQGILKESDHEVDTFILSQLKPDQLNNHDAEMGASIKQSDGMQYLRRQPAVQLHNLDYDMRVFEYQYRDEVNGLLSTRDGAWASYGGSVGPQPENRVLIAQLTTDGVLSFELNLQLAVPDGGTENYVARNPVEKEIEFQALRYTSSPSNKSPRIELKANQLKKNVQGQKHTVTAMATDEDGEIAAVDFYINDRYIYTATKAPFVFDFIQSAKTMKVSATAIDRIGAKSRSKDCFFSGPEM